MTTGTRPIPLSRNDFKSFVSLTTRWMDNDVYGHMNNVVYYSLFDTAVNQSLIAHGMLDIHHASVIGLVVHTECNYFSSVAFPDAISVGLCVEHIGTSSVRYRLGVFRGDDEICAALGQFVHVYVDRESRRPVAHAQEFLALLRGWSVSAPASDSL
jgi:acyl-CoA thioester hydrolase